MALTILPFLAGCDYFGVCNPLTSTKVTVRMIGKTDLTAGTSVTIQGLPIGSIQKVETSESGEQHLLLCIKKDQAEYLSKATLFYADKIDSGKTLVCFPNTDKDTPVSKEKLFLGFPSYSELLSWQTKNFLKQGHEAVSRRHRRCSGQQITI